MLGEKVGAIEGRITGQRVMPPENGPEVEVSAELAGELGGAQIQWLATYTAAFRPNGTLFGRGRGLVTTADGVGTWEATGIGTILGEQRASFRGDVYITSAPPELEHLTKVCLLFEYETDGEKARVDFWTWV